MDYQKNFERKKTRKEVLDPAEDFVGTLGGGSQLQVYFIRNSS